MESLRGYGSESGRSVEAGLSRVRQVCTDEQYEAARKFYPDGRLEAERIRIRRRTGGLSGEPQGDGSHWLSDAMLYMLVGSVIWACAELAQWVFREPLAGFLGVAVFALAMAIGKDR